MAKDPIEIWRIEKTRKGEILHLYTRKGVQITKEQAIKNIKNGQVYLISSDDGDNSAIALYGDSALRTSRDDTELNNLTGCSNLKVDIIDE